MAKPFSPERAGEYPVGIGCDEVGRGALSGPVLVAAVWFEPTRIPADLLAALDDSKKVAPALREKLADRIMACSHVAVAASSATIVDLHGIRPATLDAMRRAISSLARDAHVYVDGRDVPAGLNADCTALVRGESLVPQIAASSIVAKVCRDRIMRMLARRHPAYRWESNSGYGTADHLDALRRFGATAHHRNSFAPVTGFPAASERDALILAHRMAARRQAGEAGVLIARPRMPAARGDGAKEMHPGTSM